MTRAEQAEYLTAKGWKREGELWRDRHTKYLWETSAAVGQQKLRDREANGKDGGIPQGKRVAHS